MPRGGDENARLLQDAAFVKRPGDGETAWHADARMAPLDGNSALTAWAPLRRVEAGARDSNLAYAAGSHRDTALLFFHRRGGAGGSGVCGRAGGAGPAEGCPARAAATPPQTRPTAPAAPPAILQVGRHGLGGQGLPRPPPGPP